MRRRRRNPMDTLAEALIFGAGSAVGIVVGTVISTLIINKMQANGSLDVPPTQIPGAAPTQPGAVVA